MKYIENFKLIHGDKYDYTKVVYINNKTNITILCPEHGEFSQIPKNHLKGSGCPKCAVLYKANKLRGNKDNFILRANILHSGKYDYSNVLYETTHAKVEIICPKHGSFHQAPSHHLKGSGCPKCSNKHVTTEEFIVKARKVHGWKFTYDKSEYNKQNIPIIITCPEHGDFKQKPYDHLRGVGCPNCYDSKGENIIKDILTQNKIHFIRNKTFNGCVYKGKLKYDFYLPKHNTLIEYDGIQHFKPISFFGGVVGLNETKLRDNLKNEYAKNNSIKLIRIKYNENIFNKLKSIIMKDT